MRFCKQIHIIILGLVLLCFTTVMAENWMTLSSDTVHPGDTVFMSISITNDDPFVAFQCDVMLPESMEYLENSALLTERSDDHMLIATLMEGNCLRIIVFSGTNSFFAGNYGDVVTIEINVGNVIGGFPLNLENVIIANESSQNICTGVTNGFIEVLFITGYREVEEIFKPRVFPNPFTTNLGLELFMNQAGSVRIIIMDLQGRIIYQETKENRLLAGKHIVQVTDLILPNMLSQKGTYLFKVIIKTGNEVNNFVQLITKI